MEIFALGNFFYKNKVFSAKPSPIVEDSKRLLSVYLEQYTRLKENKSHSTSTGFADRIINK
jgi:hypothetical protein